MKKLFFVLIVFCIAGTSLFAWEPQDLTKFPLGQDGKSWLLNFGIGFDSGIGLLGKDDTYIPPIRVSLDRNIGIGDKKLPFFAGGILCYSGYGYKYTGYLSMLMSKTEYFRNRLSLGGRFGYHFNWNIKNLDTYAVTTVGLTIITEETKYRNKSPDSNVEGEFLFGIDLGARYYINNWFGFWAEIGYSANSFLDIGLTFKF
ncbi:hypothetical protein R84B8_00117 [Treponema sp. R8-4-B8]